MAEKLVKELNGKVKIEDAGFDWKLFWSDVPTTQQEIDYIAWQAENDMFGNTGQKCSAQSIMFVHQNWLNTNFLDLIKSQAEKRSIKDQTSGPVMTWTDSQI